MADFSASAPCKAILFGEHYVVYGSPALAIAIEPRNAVKFESWDGDGIAMKSALGNGVISPTGEYGGPDELGIFADVAAAVFKGKNLPSCAATFEPAWKLKGVGTSASLCAAFAAGLFRLAGKKASPEEIFTAAQAGDLVAHGGRASGIDAKTVSYGCPLVFERSFSPPAFNSKPAKFALPKGSSLLLIDTNKGKREGTGKMLEVFAHQFGIGGTPEAAAEAQREAIREEYAPLWAEIEKNLKESSPKKLGAIMNENHALLRKRKMSSPGIEKAVSAALSAGACGAKLTGGGGEGGAVLALVETGNAAHISEAISASTSFGCHVLSLAKKGAGA
ncbi:Mevalonate kinase [uncultured archaeon]|nr:Mevalonate kinase [uncultured archaeon]